MRSNSASVVSGLLYTFGLVLTGSLVTALLLWFTDMREGSLPYFTYIINVLGLLTGGFITGRKCGGRGWYYGGLTGLAYFSVILLIGFLGFDAPMKMATLLYLSGAFIISAIGGVLGVNTAEGR